MIPPPDKSSTVSSEVILYTTGPLIKEYAG
jgi:hypothetical protein